MKLNTGFHLIYITMHTDEHKQQLQSYYQLTEHDLEEITKEWLVDLLVPTNPIEMFYVDNLETVLDTRIPSKIKKTEGVQYLDNTSVKTASISTDQGGYGTEVEYKKGEVTPTRDKEYPSKKRKVSPLKPSSRKKMNATRTKFETTLTSDDFDFIVASLNDASLEIEEKQEDKQEEVFS
jgi:hypothetical protein